MSDAARNGRDGLTPDGNQRQTRGQDSEVAATGSISLPEPFHPPGGEREPRRESARLAEGRAKSNHRQPPVRRRFVPPSRQQGAEQALAQRQASPAPRPLTREASREPVRRAGEWAETQMAWKRVSWDSAGRFPGLASRSSPSSRADVRQREATTGPGRIARARGRCHAWRWPPPVRTTTRYESVS